MSSILYYSNFCEHSKKILQHVSKLNLGNDNHFICIDKRVKEDDGKVYIILANGQRIIMPENVTKVPALLLLKQGFKVLYGDSIYDHFKSQVKESVKVATQNNMEPMAFAFGGFGGCGIVSDNYSFIDMDSDSLGTKGNGGVRQMHSYVSLDESNNQKIKTPTDDNDYKSSKSKDGELTIDQLQQKRNQEYSNYSK
jgi:hypothetical protein